MLQRLINGHCYDQIHHGLSCRRQSTVGLLAKRDLESLIVEKLFLSRQAFDSETGLTDIARVKAAMIRSARRVILLADSSNTPFAKIVPPPEIDVPVTDSGLPQSERKAIRRFGVESIEVNPPGLDNPSAAKGP